MIYTNFINEIKKNELSFNIIFILFLFYPFSLVFGPALIEITIFFSVFLFCFLIFKKKYKIPIKLNNINFILLVLFITICILSSLFSESIFHSLRSSVFSVRFLFYFFIIYTLLSYSKEISKIFLYFSIIFFTICLIDSYTQLISGKNILLYASSHNKITGFYFEEKKLGRFLITISPILVGLYMKFIKESLNLKLFKIFFFLNIVFIIVLFTSERVSMFYAGFTILIFIMYGYKISKKYLLLLLIPTLIFVVFYEFKIYKFHDQVNNTIKQITNNKSEFSYPSTQHRAFMHTSYELFKERPILGIGPNNYRFKCNEIKTTKIINCSTHPHNIFFQLLAETGLLGILVYIYFLIYIMSRIINFITFKINQNINIFFILPVFYFCNPFFPSGNFFNNWFMAIGTFALPFYLYFNENK